MFAIEFIGNRRLEFGELAVRGRITVGRFSEQFVAPHAGRMTGDKRLVAELAASGRHEVERARQQREWMK